MASRTDNPKDVQFRIYLFCKILAPELIKENLNLPISSIQLKFWYSHVSKIQLHKFSERFPNKISLIRNDLNCLYRFYFFFPSDPVRNRKKFKELVYKFN